MYLAISKCIIEVQRTFHIEKLAWNKSTLSGFINITVATYLV